VTVSVNPSPLITASSTVNAICPGTSVTLFATGAGSYTWSPMVNPVSINGSTVTTNPNITATYTVTGSLGTCTNTALVTVNVFPQSPISVSGQTICAGSSATLTANGVNSYTWQPGALSSSSISVNPASTQVYTVSGTAASGCRSTGFATLTVVSSTVTVAGPSRVCAGQSATLSASGALSYTWSTGETLPVITVTPSLNMSYTVTGASGNCTNQAVASISLDDYPLITSSSLSNATCGLANGTFSMAVSPANSNIVWLNYAGGGGHLAAGQYSISITNNGCTTYTAIEIRDAGSPVITSSLVVHSDCMENNGLFVVDVVKGGTGPYLFSFNNGPFGYESRYHNLRPGVYSYQVKDAGNCIVASTLEIRSDGEGTLYVPNTFTPNSDNINDVWHVSGSCIRNFNCAIFNRWGQKLKELNDYTEGWDGIYKGSSVPDGIYVYLIEVEFANKENVRKTGHITVFR
jgi:gliding motility-associated-like protein